MTKFRVSLLAVCLLAFRVLAQELQPAEVPSLVLENEGKQNPVERAISTEVDVSGTSGTLLFEAGTDTILRSNNALRFQTGGATDRVWFHSNGHASFGASNDQARLSLFEYGDGARALNAYHRSTVETTVTQNDFGAAFQMYTDIAAGVTNSGSMYGIHVDARNFGPGTVADINGASIYAGNYSTGAGSATNVRGLFTQVQSLSGTIQNGYGVVIADTLATNDWGLYQTGASDSNYFAGNVIIGGPSSVTIPANNVLYVKGESYFDGTVTGTNIRAHYQDLAEWVPATTDLTPGTVVILNRGRNNEVMASATSYDTSVAGVVSAQPGITLGIEGEGMEQIATTGRVKVRVDARQKPVGVGDLLVTSDTPGTAMRSEPMDINGRKFHQPGTIIGKALEPLEGGIGEILVLLSMQ